MNHDDKTTLDDLPPLPAGLRLRSRKFGANPASPLVPTPAPGARAGTGQKPQPVSIRWEDKGLGLAVTVLELQETGHLVADVFCADAGQRGKAAVSVALVGNIEDRMIRKSIPLDVGEKDGCSGSAEFGKLADAVAELGTELGVVVFLECDRPG